MITIKNGPLTGRGDTVLTIETSGGESQPMSVAGIMETACYYRANMDAQADTADLATMRSINKILDVVEKDGCCVGIEDDQYEKVFAGGHDGSVAAVYNGDADFGVAYDLSLIHI